MFSLHEHAVPGIAVVCSCRPLVVQQFVSTVRIVLRKLSDVVICNYCCWFICSFNLHFVFFFRRQRVIYIILTFLILLVRSATT